MGSKFVEGRSVEFSKSYEESSQSTPIFFILSPGVDPLKDVEALGKSVPISGSKCTLCPGHMEEALKNHRQRKKSFSTLMILLGQKLGFTIDNGKIHNVSLGQGQEVVAENALDVAAEEGHWVILQVLK